MPKTRMNRTILTGRRPTKKRATMSSTTTAASKGIAAAIVPTFLHMLNTVKLFHWKTSSFATHKATDELYGNLNNKIDEFVEVMLGKDELGGRAKLLQVSMIKLTVYSNNNAFKKQIESYKKFLIDLSSEKNGFNTIMNADLLAIRDELLAHFNQFLYLLSLR